MPEIVLDVTQDEYEKAGSKFITFNPSDPVGKLYFKEIELDVPDWDNVGISLKFPIRITEKGPDEGKEDKMSCGVGKEAIWKLKDTLKELGVKLEMRKGADKQTHPVFDSDEVAGKKAVGCWEVQIGSKGGDKTRGEIKYPKLVAIYAAGYKPAVKGLV